MAPQGKSDASRIQWNSTMDEHLTGVLKEEHLTGGRHPDGTWKHDALAHAAKEVYDQTGEEVTVEHVRARRRYLQDNYKKAREYKEKSGFGWNASTQLSLLIVLLGRSLLRSIQSTNHSVQSKSLSMMTWTAYLVKKR